MHTKNAQGVPNLEDGSYKKFFLDMCQNSLGVSAKLQKPKYNSSKTYFLLYLLYFFPHSINLNLCMRFSRLIATDINLRILIPLNFGSLRQIYISVTVGQMLSVKSAFLLGILSIGR